MTPRHPPTPAERFGVVVTGGTIASVARDAHIELADAEQGLRGPRELIRLAAALSDADELPIYRPLHVLSEDIVPADWIEIATAVCGLVEREEISHVLVLHGTDTMAHTAAALSFLLAPMDIVVVLTGANIPPGVPGSDAAKNVHDAVVALSCLPAGTYLTFAGARDLPGWVHVGTRVRKLAIAGATFVTCGSLPVGKVVGERFVRIDLRPRPEPPNGLIHAVDERVLCVRVFPGLDFDALLAAITAADIRGVVVELYPSGTGPMRSGRYSLTRFVSACAERGITVVTTAPTSGLEDAGRSFSAEYPSVAALREAGALSLGDALTETATVKLMWALAQSDDASALRALLQRPVAGEFTQL